MVCEDWQMPNNVHYLRMSDAEWKAAQPTFTKAFDIFNEACIRLYLVETDSQCYVVMETHHLFFDGISQRALWNAFEEAVQGIPLYQQGDIAAEMNRKEIESYDSEAYRRAEQTLGSFFLFNVVLAVLVCGVIEWQCSPLVRFFGGSDQTAALSELYLRISTPGNALCIVSGGLAPFLLAQGRSREAGMVISSGILLNILGKIIKNPKDIYALNDFCFLDTYDNITRYSEFMFGNSVPLEHMMLFPRYLRITMKIMRMTMRMTMNRNVRFCE